MTFIYNLFDDISCRYKIRDLGKAYGHVDKNGTWYGAIRRVMDGVRRREERSES